MPLRSASYASLIGGILSVLYSVYIVVIYIFKKDLIQGWTTMSLQLAGMMFIFSLIFLFLSEYIIQIHAANPPRTRRHLIAREIRSTLSRRSARLNVVNSAGDFQLGAPSNLSELAGRAKV